MNHKPTRPTVGPRGGRTVQGTPCSECVSWRSCRPAQISEPFGCESWADQDGRRALPDQLDPDLDGAALYERDRLEAEADIRSLTNPDPATPCEACQGVPSECGPCGCPEVEDDPSYPHDEEDGISSEHLDRWALENTDPEPEPFRPAEAYRPDPSRGEGPAQSVLPMADAGPLFAGCPEARR